MAYHVHVASAFTDDVVPALGSKAGLTIFDRLPDSSIMAEIAQRTALPVTTFVAPRDSSGTNFSTRWYDASGRECHICGHATVAASVQLARLHRNLDEKDLYFYVNSDFFDGVEHYLRTQVSGSRVSLDLPSGRLSERQDPDLRATLAQGLRIDQTDIDSVAFVEDIRDYVIAVRDASVVARIQPDIPYLKAMAETGPYQHEGLMVSAPANDGQFDLHVRVFLPIMAIDEAQACGSGNCSIVPYWYKKGLKTNSRGTYKALFPYPDGPDGYVGGVQDVAFDPRTERVTIHSQATVHEDIVVELAADNEFPRAGKEDRVVAEA